MLQAQHGDLMQQCWSCPAPFSSHVRLCTWKCEADRLMGPRADITQEDKALFLAYACSGLPHDSLQKFPSPSHRRNLSFGNPRWHLTQRGRRKVRSRPVCGRSEDLQANLKLGASYLQSCSLQSNRYDAVGVSL